MSGGAYALWEIGKFIGKAVAWPFDQASDAFNANVDSVPEYTRRLQMKIPLTLDGQEYTNFEEASEAFKQKISDKMGVGFNGDVSSDGKIAIHSETNKIVNTLDAFNEATGNPSDMGADKLELHFRDAKTLESFFEEMGLRADPSGKIYYQDQTVTPEGGAEWTLTEGPLSKF